MAELMEAGTVGTTLLNKPPAAAAAAAAAPAGAAAAAATPGAAQAATTKSSEEARAKRQRRDKRAAATLEASDDLAEGSDTDMFPTQRTELGAAADPSAEEMEGIFARLTQERRTEYMARLNQMGVADQPPAAAS